MGEKNLPSLAQNWDANIKLINFNNKQEKKLRSAINIIRKIIPSHEFREKVLNYKYKGKISFNNNQGLTNREIYEKILEGEEIIDKNGKNNIMDAELELYYQPTTTIGYTYPDTKRIWINEKYFEKFSPIKVADNLMHEWMHKLGFNHEVIWNEERDHSVPYAIGYIIEELARKHENFEE